MKIKRYFAPDIKQAIRMVREEQGPDAVILSNRKVDGGVEIVAARDFDERAMMKQLPAAGREGSSDRPRAASEDEPSVRVGSQRRAEAVFRETVGGAQRNAAPVNAGSLHKRAEKTPTQTQRISDGPTPPAKPDDAASLDPGHTRALLDVQRELRQMRRTLDVHFAETAWENSARSAPTRLDLLRRLCACGFSKKLSLQIANRLGGVADFALACQASRDLLASQLPVCDDDLLDRGGVVALIGPTGVGKTTTIAKLAARFRLKHGPRQIALITTDNYRIAAHEQLSTYGRILDVPVRVVTNAEELSNCLAGFSDKRLVLIDTAGMGQRDKRLTEQLSVLRQAERSIKPYLVLSAASQARAMREAVEAFSGCEPQACILTKLDETPNLGVALSTLIERQLPLAYVSDGQQVPEDLHPARTHLLLDQCFADPIEIGREDQGGGGVFAYEDWVAYAHV
jgi:flagellar biosynthesis protein FlhF